MNKQLHILTKCRLRQHQINRCLPDSQCDPRHGPCLAQVQMPSRWRCGLRDLALVWLWTFIWAHIDQFITHSAELLSSISCIFMSSLSIQSIRVASKSCPSKLSGLIKKENIGPYLLKSVNCVGLQPTQVCGYFRGADVAVGGQLPQVLEIAESGGGNVIREHSQPTDKSCPCLKHVENSLSSTLQFEIDPIQVSRYVRKKHEFHNPLPVLQFWIFLALFSQKGIEFTLSISLHHFI